MIDPTIPLQVNYPQTQFPQALDWAKIATAANQIPLIQAETRNQNAQTPGIAAHSTSLQQQAENDVQDQQAKNLAIELASMPDFQTTDPVTGNTQANMPKVFGAVSSKFPNQAIQMWKASSDLDNQKAISAKSAVEADVASQDFQRNQVQTLANIVDQSNLSPEDKVKHFNDGIVNLANHYPKAFQASPYVTPTAAVPALTGTPAQPGAPIPGQQVSPGVQSYPVGNTLPQQQPAPVANTGLPQNPGSPGTPAQSGQPAGFKPALVPTNGALKAADITAIANGSMDPLTKARLGISQNELTLAQIQGSLPYKTAIAGITPPDVQATFAGKEAEERNYANFLGNSANAAVANVPTGPGALTQSAWNSLVEKGGPYAQLQAGLDRYNQKNGTQYTIWGSGVGAVQAKLKQDAGVSNTLADQYHIIATPKTVAPKTLSGSSITQVPPANPAAAPAYTPGRIVNGLPVMSPQQARGLKPGTQFMGTDGKTYTR